MPQAGSSTDLAQLRVGHRHHELDHGPRRVELAAVAGRIAHLLEHAFIQRAQRMDIVRGREVDLVDPVDHLAQHVAADHAVNASLRRRGRSHPAGHRAVVAAQVLEIFEQSLALLAVGQGGFVVVDEVL